jgi:hypothetical protein
MPKRDLFGMGGQPLDLAIFRYAQLRAPEALWMELTPSARGIEIKDAVVGDTPTMPGVVTCPGREAPTQ